LYYFLDVCQAQKNSPSRNQQDEESTSQKPPITAY